MKGARGSGGRGPALRRVEESPGSTETAVPGNARRAGERSPVQGKCHRKQTAALRRGKGERVG